MQCLASRTFHLVIWRKPYAEILCNQSLLVLVQRLKKSSVEEGTNLAPNQQVLLLSDKVEEIPDMYGWKKETAETFAKWLDIELEFEVQVPSSKRQDVRTNTAIKNIKKIKLTLGD